MTKHTQVWPSKLEVCTEMAEDSDPCDFIPNELSQVGNAPGQNILHFMGIIVFSSSTLIH